MSNKNTIKQCVQFVQRLQTYIIAGNVLTFGSELLGWSNNLFRVETRKINAKIH